MFINKSEYQYLKRRISDLEWEISIKDNTIKELENENDELIFQPETAQGKNELYKKIIAWVNQPD